MTGYEIVGQALFAIAIWALAYQHYVLNRRKNAILEKCVVVNKICMDCNNKFFVGQQLVQKAKVLHCPFCGSIQVEED